MCPRPTAIAMLLVHNRACAAHRDPAIRQQRLSGNVARSLTGKEYDRAIQIVGPSGAIQRDAFLQNSTHPSFWYITLFCSVSNQPGASAFTVMPCLPQSSARLIVSWRMPPRLAPYGARPA